MLYRNYANTPKLEILFHPLQYNAFEVENSLKLSDSNIKKRALMCHGKSVTQVYRAKMAFLHLSIDYKFLWRIFQFLHETTWF